MSCMSQTIRGTLRPSTMAQIASNPTLFRVSAMRSNAIAASPPSRFSAFRAPRTTRSISLSLEADNPVVYWRLTAVSTVLGAAPVFTLKRRLS